MDKALKQRLVGAIVLIALAVIVLPMIFGGRPSPNGPGPTEIELPAAPPDLEFEKRRFPVGDQTTPQPPATTDSEPDVVSSQPQPDRLPPAVQQPSTEDVDATAVAEELSAQDIPSGVETPQAPTVEQVESVDSAVDVTESQVVEPQETRSEQATPPPGSQTPEASLRYVVQVASFGNAQNATRLASQLEEAGYAVLLDHVSSETARLNRVRVGPYPSEAAAQSVVRELRDRFDGINPRIVDLQPDQVSPAIASEDPLLRWVVQVGSFGSAENAENLVARLRLSGHSAYDEAVSTDTSTIYRVRVGPFLDREEAIRVEQRIRSDMGLSGVVMSAD